MRSKFFGLESLKTGYQNLNCINSIINDKSFVWKSKRMS